jgi:glycosyltransferase involved in cell wall biosynthesis
MRVLFVVNEHDAGEAGGQLATLCEGLAHRGVELVVASVQDRVGARQRLDDAGARIVPLHGRGGFDLAVLHRLRRLVAEERPDLVHAFLPDACLYAGLTRWLGAAPPVVQSVRSLDASRAPLRLALDNLVSLRVAAITCSAETIRRQVVVAERAPAARVVVIPDGLSSAQRTRPADDAIEAARRSIAPPPGAFVLTRLANADAGGGHAVLLGAFAKALARRSDLVLVLAGCGAGEAEVRRAAAASGVAHAVRFPASAGEPSALLCASDAAILVSDAPGSATALLEAMAMRLPVVAPDAGALPELVERERGGLLCRADDEEAFAAAILRLAGDPALRRAMGRHNVARVRAEFTHDSMVERTLALYERVLRQRHRVRGATIVRPAHATGTPG